MIYKIFVTILFIIFIRDIYCKTYQKPFFPKRVKIKLHKKRRKKNNINAIVKGYENLSDEQKEQEYIEAIWEEIK